MSDEPKRPSAAAEILAYSQRVNQALTGFARRTHYEPATDVTPLHLLIAAEDGSLDEWGAIRETAVRLLQWFAADGIEPEKVMRRVFVLADHMMIEPYCLLTLREKAMLLGDSHGAQLWRMQRLCVDPLMRQGCRNYKASGQKGRRASAAAAAAQKGNQNRANGAGHGNGAKRRGKPNRRTYHEDTH